MKKGVLFYLSAVSIFLIWGCYPQGAEYTEELDVVVTKHQPEYDFSAKATYAMPDEIVIITGNLVEGEEPEFMPDENAARILGMIEQNMTALGYDRVLVDEDPDLLLMPASWETTTVIYWYDYWYYWWGGYYPGWGWSGYYPYTPPVYVSSYTTGTLLMTLIDKEVLGVNGNPIIQWWGAANGILTGYYNESRISKAINQAFDQSPYLKTN
jgi:hypothetical protein